MSKIAVLLAALLTLGLAAAPSALASPGPGTGGLSVVQTVTGPGVPAATPPSGQWCVDLSYVHRMLVGGKRVLVDFISNASARVITRVVAATGRLLRPLRGPFTGPAGCEQFDFAREGPQGMVIARGFLWAGNGNGHVLVFCLRTGRLVADLPTGAVNRADEAATDGRRVWFTAPDEARPFIAIFDARTRHLLRRVTIPGASSLEQPAYDPAPPAMGGHLFYVAVPAAAARPGGEVAVMRRDGSLARTLGIGDCNPSGLAVNPRGGTLALGCDAGKPSLIIATWGRVLATLPAVSGVDEVQANPRGPGGTFAFGNFTGQGCQLVSFSGVHWADLAPAGLGFHACATATTSAGFRALLPVTGQGVQIWAR